MEPLISVIMPVYNQEKYLSDTIKSVIDQSFQNFEFIILDDGSTDNSAKIIQDYAELDKRIIPLFENNSGKCLATNKISGLAKGEWLAFLDADDLMLPDRLEKQLAFHMANPDVDASSCHCYYINEKGEKLGQQCYPFLKTLEECKQVLLKNEIIHCAFTGLMTTKNSFESVGGLRAQFWPCEDLEFANRLIEKGYNLLIIQDILMMYRIHASSITAQKQWHMFDMSDYTRYNINLRRSGKSEISFDDFKLMKQNESWRVKFGTNRYRYSQTLHKNAGFDLYHKNYIRFCCRLVAASILAPSYVLATVRNRLNLKRNFKN